MPSRTSSRPAGFTLIEMLIAMVVGVLVLSAAMTVGLSTFRSLTGVQLRDGIDRNARFIGLALQRDLTETGVDVDALPDFGTLAVWNDTIAILRVPFDTAAAPIYHLDTLNFSYGVCGAACLDITTTGAPQLAVGDLARFQLNTARRLVVITSLSPVTGGYRVNFSSLATILNHNSVIPTGGLNAGNAASAFVQRLALVAYWRQGTQLMRGVQVDTSGAILGEAVADGVQSFQVTLIFTDGDELDFASGSDADTTNNYDQISGIRTRAIIQADRADQRVSSGILLTRSYEWFVSPRNLIYERNAIP
ncbi:MAG: prepilin-type N-terminal cleavage/methylation domain-containing protein [Gemmatimonadota bacterium]|nr:prepilin-type N-terminal cleavage/methylation domain-containing protein [Gemmatimonadota bacterium]